MCVVTYVIHGRSAQSRFGHAVDHHTNNDIYVRTRSREPLLMVQRRVGEHEGYTSGIHIQVHSDLKSAFPLPRCRRWACITHLVRNLLKKKSLQRTMRWCYFQIVYDVRRGTRVLLTNLTVLRENS